MGTNPFISKADQATIVKAIESAELNTSGEIRVHIESNCPGDPVARAVYVFNKLKMYKTKERNGVLIYIAWKTRKFSIIGDDGINKVVPENFWQDALNLLGENLKSGNTAQGLCKTIELAGEKLKVFFPIKSDDTDEQSNEISFGD
ncbi:hypothetical protein SDC9_42681 [bioreactor metagenome]|mgnify:FL=1|uniref:TPM domain-containing protein n=2 Tax=ecological metagenomes TaxID=410657 RepID=A0A0A8KWQ9_9ZZZZ|nr:TPM domain-containing protein [Bacteroidales bacterium]MBP8677899.1 TPM domain-containing protein [Bacteroidales bacterium]MBP9584594.1 TPM domain-containing protein [Bacteroidales bacterium]MBP9978583.1 TPM domain-containing protein [Bacteroidales bacterium]WRQ32713.1 TPM domain-containing protein [Bacteroidales bacterium MB20-C3-3]